MSVPASLDWIRGRPGGPDWLASLPRLIDASAERWGLRLGPPFEDVFESMTFPATLADGSPAVLKVAFRSGENEHEAAALRCWNGDGAIRLLDEDPDRDAMLLERAVPGTPLSDVSADDALDAFVDLLPRLWVTAGPPFGSLADEAARLSGSMARNWERLGRPFQRRLIDAATDAFADLAPTQGEPVLLHQDLHADNVLRAERQPWLAIDPKPLLGEREFGVAPIVRSRELGHSRRDVIHRLDRLTADLGLDRERARLWTMAQTVAWSCEDQGVVATHLDTARWLLAA